MISNTPALNDDALDVVSGGLKKGESCVGSAVMITTDKGTLTLGSTTGTIGGSTVVLPFGSWQPA